MKTNKDKVVMQSAIGEISSPTRKKIARVGRNGIPFVYPGTGGINYNVKLGDNAFGLAGDHVEPGVSMKNPEEPKNHALITLACAGNEAKVISGDAKGKKGYVVGSHGGIEHIIVHFEDSILEDLAIGDKIQIKGYGEGLLLFDEYEDVYISKLDPRLFEKLVKDENGKLTIPVTTIIPGYLMGSGVGDTYARSGDYDITTGDEQAVKENNIDKIKLGDFVFIKDHYNLYGREHRSGSGTVGVVVHSDCLNSGHGPGVTTLITTLNADKFNIVIDPNANIKNYM